ncbi:MAG: hypothetical protein FWF10_10890 [Clostridiales bacterium]|nr:hypothetical protein [Clostridiales bacterium]
MKYLLRLTKLNLSALLSGFRTRGKDGREAKRARNRLTVYIILAVCALMMSASYSAILAMAGQELGNMLILPTIMSLAASVLTVFSAMMRARSMLFQNRDYDFLMALPIPKKAVAGARLLAFYAIDLVFALAVMLPCGIFYAIYAQPAWPFYALFLPAVLLLPVIPIAVGGLIGTLFSALFARSRARNIINMVLQFIFLLGIVILQFGSAQFTENLHAAAGNIGAQAAGIYPFADWFARGFFGGQWLYMLAYLSVTLAIGAAFIFVVIRAFSRICSLLGAQPKAGKFAMSAQKSGHVLSALYKREWKRYLNCPVYVLNTLGGSLLLLVGAVFLVIYRDIVLGLAAECGLSGFIAPALALLSGWFTMLSATTTASVSLEGKTLWLSKSLPIRAATWLTAKLLLGFTVSGATATATALFVGIGLGLAPADFALVFLLPLALGYAGNVFGLWLNLKNPKFDWRNETEVVKQSMPTMIIALGSMALCALAVAALAILGPLALIAFAALCALLAILTHASVMKNAEGWRNGM